MYRECLDVSKKVAYFPPAVHRLAGRMPLSPLSRCFDSLFCRRSGPPRGKVYIIHIMCHLQEIPDSCIPGRWVAAFRGIWQMDFPILRGTRLFGAGRRWVSGHGCPDLPSARRVYDAP